MRIKRWCEQSAIIHDNLRVDMKFNLIFYYLLYSFKDERDLKVPFIQFIS